MSARHVNASYFILGGGVWAANHILLGRNSRQADGDKYSEMISRPSQPVYIRVRLEQSDTKLCKVSTKY